MNETFQLHYSSGIYDLPACSAMPQPTAPPSATAGTRDQNEH